MDSSPADLGAHYGIEHLGATVIPVSGGQTQRQMMLLQDFGPDIICSTPSYILNLAELGEKMGVDFDNLKLKVGILGAEPGAKTCASKSKTD